MDGNSTLGIDGNHSDLAVEAEGTLKVDGNENAIVADQTVQEKELAHMSSSSSIPKFHIPPHLFGRDLNNLEDEIATSGRKLQKPRLGVKVPHRNLTSQIVTQDEIAQEIYERASKRYPVLEIPPGGSARDILLSLNMKQNISKFEAEEKTETKGDFHNIDLPIHQSNEVNCTLPSDFPINNYNSTNNTDNGELLAILEGDGDPNWSTELVKGYNKDGSAKKPKDPTPKLDPAVERELALKQLMELPVRSPRKKVDKKADLVPRKKGRPRKYRPENNNNRTDGGDKRVILIQRASNQPLEKKVAQRRQVKEEVVESPTSVSSSNNSVKHKLQAVRNGNVKLATFKSKERMLKTQKLKRLMKKNLITKKMRTNAYDIENEETGHEVVNNVPKEYFSKPLRTYISPKKKMAQLNGEIEDECSITSQSERDEQTARDEERVNVKAEEMRTSTPIKNQTDTEKGKRRMKEVERLLQDEGAINLLYDVEQEEVRRRSGVENVSETIAPKRTTVRSPLKSVRRKKKDLLLKKRMVKNAVLRLTETSSSNNSGFSLRGKRSAPLLLEAQAKNRKLSVDSRDALNSPPLLNPYDQESVSHLFALVPKVHLPAEASKIIRRHSSSSTFSSRSASPNNQMRSSMEIDPNSVINEDCFPKTKDNEESKLRKKGIPIYVRKKEVQQTYKGKKKINQSDSELSSNQTEESADEPKNLNKSVKQTKKKQDEKIKEKSTKRILKNEKNTISGKGKKVQGQKMGPSPELSSCLADVARAFGGQEMIVKKNTKQLKTGSPSRGSLKKNATQSDLTLENDDGGSSVTASVYQYKFKELNIRRYDHLVQIILTPVSTKMKNSFNALVFRELVDVLDGLDRDASCSVVVLTSTGSTFCQGIDFCSLVNPNSQLRLATAQLLSNALGDFVRALVTFGKPLIAGVHGAALGLGVTMLPYFDMVYASDKATFYTPFAKLGQAPEGAISLVLPHKLGNAATSELLFGCRKLTASEAVHFGLVTRVLWPDRFQEELIPILHSIANQSLQSMETTKCLLRSDMISKLDKILAVEKTVLVEHWTSQECQQKFQSFLLHEEVDLQKGSDP